MKAQLSLTLILVASMGYSQQQPAAAGAQDQAQAPSKDPKVLASIEGRTVTAAGQPIRKVMLTLRRMDAGSASTAITASTDSEGKFVFSSLEPGRYNLWAEKAGYLRQSYGSKQASVYMSAGTPLALTSGQHLKDISFELTPQAVISGKVLDDEGDPVGRALVQILRYAYRNGKRRPSPMQGQPSDENGEFKISGLAPGRYFVCASRPMSMMGGESARPAQIDRTKPDEYFITTCYPNGTDLASAAPVDVGVGREAPGIDIRLRKSVVVNVSGSVSGDIPPDRLRLSLMSADPNNSLPSMGPGMGASVGKDGTFTLYRVAPGSYRIVVFNSNENRMQVCGSQRVDVGHDDVRNVSVSLIKAAELKGVIRLDGQSAAAQAANRPFQVGLVPSDESVFNYVPNVSAEADGAFKLAAVSPGKYRLQVFPIPDGAYLKSVRLSNQEVLETGLDFTAGVAGSLEVTLKAAAAQVDGIVKDEQDKPLLGATVTLVPEPPNPDLTFRYTQASTDQNGKATLKSIAPGSYRAYAWESLEFGAQMDTELMNQLSSYGVSVKLDENGHEQINLKSIPEKAVEQARARAGK